MSRHHPKSYRRLKGAETVAAVGKLHHPKTCRRQLGDKTVAAVGCSHHPKSCRRQMGAKTVAAVGCSHHPPRRGLWWGVVRPVNMDGITTGALIIIACATRMPYMFSSDHGTADIAGSRISAKIKTQTMGMARTGFQSQLKIRNLLLQTQTFSGLLFQE